MVQEAPVHGAGGSRAWCMVQDMAVSTAVDGTGTTVVEYRTKDYANIFGKDYADNECTTGSKPAH